MEGVATFGMRMVTGVIQSELVGRSNTRHYNDHVLEESGEMGLVLGRIMT